MSIHASIRCSRRRWGSDPAMSFATFYVPRNITPCNIRGGIIISYSAYDRIFHDLNRLLLSSESAKLMPRKFAQGSKTSKLKMCKAFMLAERFADRSNTVRTRFVNSLALMIKRPTSILISKLCGGINNNINFIAQWIVNKDYCCYKFFKQRKKNQFFITILILVMKWNLNLPSCPWSKTCLSSFNVFIR